MVKSAPKEDIAFILEHTKSAFDRMSGENILLTGATGFFGKWLTQAFLAANDRLQAKNTLTLVTRDKEQALKSLPWLSDRRDVRWIESDIRDFNTKDAYTTVIHAATAASRDLVDNRPQLMFDTIVEGTRNVLKSLQGSCKRLLFVSSGAIYGETPKELGGVSEDYFGGPDQLSTKASYAEGKRAAELLCAIKAREQGFDLKIARCFAFVGPYLPLDIHYAVGNFMNNVLAREEIKIGGDGTAVRSYLYAADLVVWLLRILADGEPNRAYNVGSERGLSILEIANEVHSAGCALFQERNDLEDPIQVAKKPEPGRPKHVYLPSTQRAQKELGLREWTDFKRALSKTLSWHSNGEKK